jgi:hypothetical protein
MPKAHSAEYPDSSTLYETDFHAWTRQQAALLRAKRFSELDETHLCEELDDLGRSERRSLVSHLGVLLGHLLKWQYQPGHPNRKSWRVTINEQRLQVETLLADNPSLRPQLATLLEKAYRSGLNLAVAETPLDYDAFPKACPWTEEQVLGDHWP